MKSSTVKATYSLDTLTALEIEALARRWKIPKSEVIRRSVHAAARHQEEILPVVLTPREALSALQAEPRLTSEKRQAWMDEARAERRAR